MSPPQTASTPPWITLAMPMVAINTATAGWPDSGRNTARSTNTASRPIPPNAITNAAQGARPKLTVPA